MSHQTMTLSSSSEFFLPDIGTETTRPWQPSPVQPPVALRCQSDAKPLRKNPAVGVTGQLSPTTAANRAACGVSRTAGPADGLAADAAARGAVGGGPSP